MKIKDHFLSQDTFEVKPSQYKGILKTTPQPSATDLPKYYESPDYISHQIKSKSLKDIIYQKVKSVMIKRKLNWVFDYQSSGSILDIGAGTGEFLEAFNFKDWNKSAIEPSKKLHSNLEQKDIQLYSELHQIKESSQDVITLWHSLEHIPNLEESLEELKRILKPDGVLFIAVPNHKSYDAVFYKSYWAAWDVPRHLWHFSRYGLKNLLSNYSFECVEEKPLIFDAYYVSILSEKYHPKGNLLRSIYKGWLSNQKARANKDYSSILYVLRAN
jgi:SAM-dependent methyltransferase